MKHSGRCPKCESSDIIADAMLADRSAHAAYDTFIRTCDDPTALLFKGYHVTRVSAWVCADCGYVELYAESPNVIRTRTRPESDRSEGET
jgi:predicted nucleic-acid-binding Zn-ribbon protein